MRHSKTALSYYPKPLSKIPEHSFTLPSYLYTDPDAYEIEKERIFYRSWQYVGHKSLFQEPGDYVTARICDQHVFVIKGDDSELRAFYNVCQHRAHELLPEGLGNVARAIVCPYHAWTFSKNGNLRGAPRSEQRPGFDRNDYSLKSVRLEMFADCAFVNLDPDARALSEMAGDLETDIRTRLPYARQLNTPLINGFGETEIEAGWKVVIDNYIECYHCEHAHPAFVDLLCMDTFEHHVHDYWTVQVAPDVRKTNSAYDLGENPETPQSNSWFLWPNTTFSALPGGAGLKIAVARPTEVGRTSFGGHTISVSGDHDKARGKYTAEVLVPEDIALCESVQRGLQSKGYSQGPMIVDPDRTGRGEHAIHHFHRLVQKALA